MAPLYSVDSLARLVQELVLLLWLGSEVVHGSRVLARRFRSGHIAGSVGQDRFSGPALIIGVGLAIGIGIRAAVFVPQAAITFFRPELFGFGIALAVAGIAFRWYAIARLGRFFETRVTV